jgi:hypothetical protein
MLAPPRSRRRAIELRQQRQFPQVSSCNILSTI